MIDGSVPAATDALDESRTRSPMLGSLLGALAHTAVCWMALQLDFFRGGEPRFYQIIALIWAGHLSFAVLFASGLNRRFRDPDLTLPIMLWSTVGLLLSAFYVDQVRLCVMVMFFAILQPGVFRLRFRAFALVSLFCTGGYALILWWVSRAYPEAIDLTAEVIQWAAFTLITGAVVAVAAEISGLRSQLARRNRQLAGIVERIQDMAIKDELTRLYNRRYAVERLIKLREMANRNSFGFVVAYVDLDFFKRVNDNHGHQAGDEVLRRFAAMVNEKLSGRDFAARLGGEEFLVVLAKCTLEEGRAIAETIREEVQALRFPSAPDLRMTTSIGVAEFQRGESLDQLLARADDALYQAKGGGRNRTCVAGGGSE